MRYRQLGQTGISVSEIGFGCWGIGGSDGGAVAYGKTDDVASLRALHAAVEHGINFFDTAAFYGNGHSEELLGAAFSGRRDQVVIASKGGMLNPAGDQDFSPAFIRSCVEGSLRRLGTDYIDLFQWHSPPVSDLDGYAETTALLARFVDEGKIRALGFSARSPAEARIALEKQNFAAVQANLNLADQRAVACGLIDHCGQKSVGLVVRTPLCFGFLTGQYSPEAEFGEGDHRNRWSLEQKSRWANARAEFLSVQGRYEALTSAQFALAYCLSYPEVTSAIPGMLTEDHVRENAAAGTLPVLRETDRAEIERIERERSPDLVKEGR